MNLLEGVKLIRSPTKENNYMFVFPNKARKPASMTDVLLWEVLRGLNSTERATHNDDEIIKRLRL